MKITSRKWTIALPVAMAIGFAAVQFFPSKSTEQSKTQITSLCPTDVELTDAVVSSSLNLSPERISAVKAARALSNNDLCTMPKAKLDRAMYRTDHPKADKPGEWAKFRAMQQADESGTVKPNGLANAVAQRHAMLAANTAARAAGQIMPMAGITQSAWAPLGPGNIGGRTRTIAPHPTDPNKLWLGSVGGGIWKTTDGGASWSAVNDFMGNIAVSALAISPDGNTLYAGTGEGFFNADALRGAGIFKSTDGGTTWSQLPNASPAASTDWYYVNRIAIQPGTPTTVLAATNSGLYKSTDSGATWSKTYSDSNGVADIKFNPADNTHAILGTGWGSGTIAYSADAGSTWTNSPSFTAKGRRVELAYGSGNTAYAAYDHASSGSGQIWKSTDAGATWALISTPGHLGNQGWYDNTIWVDPTNNNHLIIGGLDLYRSTNGGTTWTQISQWYSVASGSVHADHHTIVSATGYGISNKTIYFGNDGGIYKAADITAVTSVTTGWTKLNNGLAITQFYSGAGHNGTNGHVIGGAQDNGSLLYAGSGSNWSEYYGGDGGYSDVDPTDGNYLYGEYVYLKLHRSTDGGASASYIYSGITDAGSNANFIAPFALDLNNSNTMLAGGASLWRSTNVKAATPTWTAIKVSTGSGWYHYISAIATAQGTGGSDKIWVGHNNGALYKTANGTATTPSWTQSGTGVLPGRMLLSILVDKDDHNRVYATFGGYSSGNIWRTTDGGTTWTDISTNLPQAPIRSVQRHPNRANYLYVGTEVGVFTSEDGGTTWTTSNDGPANVSVDKLFWLDATTLVAATHGRGMFKVSVLLDQTITFNAVGNKTLGDPDFTLSATASSGLPVSFSGQTPAVCTVSGNTVHLVAAGNCTIRADQAGNSSYSAAPFVDRGFTISATATPSGNSGGGGGGGGAFGLLDAAVGLLLGLVAWAGMRGKTS